MTYYKSYNTLEKHRKQVTYAILVANTGSVMHVLQIDSPTKNT